MKGEGVLFYLAGRKRGDPGLRRHLRGLRGGDPPEAWAVLLAAPGAARLPLDLLRALGIVAGHYDHLPGAHPALLLARKGEGGRRRLHRLLRAPTPLALAEELSLLAPYLGGGLDYGEVEGSMRAWGDRERLAWLRRAFEEEVEG